MILFCKKTHVVRKNDFIFMDVKIGNQYLANVAKFKHGKMFTIIVRDHKINVTENLAICFSEKIRSLIELRQVADIYAIKTEILESTTVNAIESLLMTGIYEGNLNSKSIEELYNIGIELRNNDIIEPYISYINSLGLNSENIFELITAHSKLSGSSDKFKECIKYIVQHFYEIEHQKLIEFLSNGENPYFDIAEQIITDPDLIVNTEDETANFLVDLSIKNECFDSLLRHIHLQYCSKEVYTRVVNRFESILEDNEEVQIFFDFLKDYDPEIIYPRKVHDETQIPKSKLQIYERENKTLKDEKSTYEQENKRLKEGKTIYEQENKALKEQVEELTKQNDNYLEIVKFTSQEVLDKNQQIEALQNEINRLQNNNEIKKQVSISILNEIPKKNTNFDSIYCILNSFAKTENIEGLKYAVQNGYDRVLNGNDETIILHAASVGNVKLCEMLEECGSDINARDKSGRNILHKLSLANAVEGVKYFANKCAGLINMPDNNNQYPFSLGPENIKRLVKNFLPQ